MSSITRCAASLCLFGDDLVPEEISRLLNHPPNQAWMKDYQFTTSTDVVVRKTGAWILDATPSESGNVDAQIAELFVHADVETDVWLSLADKFDIEIIVAGLWARGTKAFRYRPRPCSFWAKVISSSQSSFTHPTINVTA